MGNCPALFERFASQGEVLGDGPGQWELGRSRRVLRVKRLEEGMLGMVKICVQRAPKAVLKSQEGSSMRVGCVYRGVRV